MVVVQNTRSLRQRGALNSQSETCFGVRVSEELAWLVSQRQINTELGRGRRSPLDLLLPGHVGDGSDVAHDDLGRLRLPGAALACRNRRKIRVRNGLQTVCKEGSGSKMI